MKRTGLVLKTRPAKNCKENSTRHAWLMLNKEQILRKKIRTTARCNISVKRQLHQDYFSVTKSAPLLSLTPHHSAPWRRLKDSNEIQCYLIINSFVALPGSNH